MKYKTPQVRRNYLYIAIILFAIAIGIIGVVTIRAETALSTQHWQLLNDGDTAYLLTYPGCNLIEQELGEDSRVFTLECDPAKDGQ